MWLSGLCLAECVSGNVFVEYASCLYVAEFVWLKTGVVHCVSCSSGSKGGLGGRWPPRFLAGPLLGTPSFVLNFTFKFVWWTYTVDNFQPAKFKTIWRISGDGSDDIHKPMLDLIELIEANQSSLQRKVTMQERHLCWPTYFFPCPRSGPPVFSI